MVPSNVPTCARYCSGRWQPSLLGPFIISLPLSRSPALGCGSPTTRREPGASLGAWAAGTDHGGRGGWKLLSLPYLLRLPLPLLDICLEWSLHLASVPPCPASLTPSEVSLGSTSFTSPFLTHPSLGLPLGSQLRPPIVVPRGLCDQKGKPLRRV